MFVSRLGLLLGLPMPRYEVSEISDWLTDANLIEVFPYGYRNYSEHRLFGQCSSC
jgi:hypothetical protein